MLIIVKNRYIHQLLQFLFDIETFRRFDILEIDAAKGRGYQLTGSDELIGILGAHFDVENIDVGKFFEQCALTLHNRLTGQRPNIAEAEHGRAIGYDGNQVSFGGIFVGVLTVLCNFLAGACHSGTVSQGQILLGGERFSDHHLNFPFSTHSVIFKCLGIDVCTHVYPHVGWLLIMQIYPEFW